MPENKTHLKLFFFFHTGFFFLILNSSHANFRFENLSKIHVIITFNEKKIDSRFLSKGKIIEALKSVKKKKTIISLNVKKKSKRF